MGQTLIRCWWWSIQSFDPKNTDPLLVLKSILGSAGAKKTILRPKYPTQSDPTCSTSSSSLWVRRRRKRKCWQQARARLLAMERASQVQSLKYGFKTCFTAGRRRYLTNLLISMVLGFQLPPIKRCMNLLDASQLASANKINQSQLSKIYNIWSTILLLRHSWSLD